jgi:hypothetical protein
MIKYENDYAYVDGYKFKKNTRDNYYLSSNNIGNRRKYLHIYIWEKHNGEIPKGYDIHHIDHNKDNNEISNLKMILKREHSLLHSKELTEEQKAKKIKNFNEKARPKAIEWHKSKKAEKFHKEQYKISLGKMKPQKITCENCGKDYYSICNGRNKFCSNKCKSAYRRKIGVDNIEKKCIKCGEKFEVNKYSKREQCYNCYPCRNKKTSK